jgi:hypothetical protein
MILVPHLLAEGPLLAVGAVDLGSRVDAPPVESLAVAMGAPVAHLAYVEAAQTAQ